MKIIIKPRTSNHTEYKRPQTKAIPTRRRIPFASTIFIVTALLIFVQTPSWAFIDAVVGGARTVADQAHQKIMENELIQLVITAKQNYDASMKIYAQVKQLNEGRGLARNIADDLSKRGKQMASDEQDSLEAAFTYHGDSQLDRTIQGLEWNTQRGISQNGGAIVDLYGNAVNRQSAAYVNLLKKQGQQWADRVHRSQAGREAGLKIAAGAPDLNSKAQGLQLQTFSDSLDALNQLVVMQAMRDAKEMGHEISSEKEIAESLKFLTDANGASKALQESFYLVRLSRAPGLLASTRRAVSQIVAMLLGLILAGAFIYEFSQGRNMIPETLGLPLVLVIFGLMFYDKIFVSFAAVMDAIEQTIGSNQTLLSAAGQNATQASVIATFLQGGMKYLAVALGYLNWLIVIVFLWIRFAFFCLIYAVGPIFIALGLFQPLRAMTKGWMQGALQVGLWGIFMRIMVFVMINSGANLADASSGLMKPMFASLVIAVVFLTFSIICPYFTHHLVSGHIAERALATVSAISGPYQSLRKSQKSGDLSALKAELSALKARRNGTKT